MKRDANLILIEREGGWEAQDVARGLRVRCEDSSAIGFGKMIGDLVGSHSAPGNAVLLLASTSVYFLRLRLSGSKRTNDAIRFAAESKLPLDAESIVVDTLSDAGTGTDQITAVATNSERLRDKVRELESNRIRVVAIVPETLVWLQSWLDRGQLKQPSRILLLRSSEVEICKIDAGGRLTDWQVTNATSARERLKQWYESNGGEDATLYCAVMEESARGLASEAWLERAKPLDGAESKYLLPLTDRIVSKRSQPWVNLFQTPLADRAMAENQDSSLKLFAAAATVFVALLAGWLALGIVRDQKFTASCDRELRELYSQLHPNEKVPGAVGRRLQSEYREIKNQQAALPKDNGEQSAISVLRQFVEGLPQEWPFEVEEVRIDPQKLFVQCAVTKQEDAGKLVAAMEKSGLECEPPSITLRADNRFLATVLASLPQASSTIDRPDSNRGEPSKERGAQ
jgi:hypothetical protein